MVIQKSNILYKFIAFISIIHIFISFLVIQGFSMFVIPNIVDKNDALFAKTSNTDPKLASSIKNSFYVKILNYLAILGRFWNSLSFVIVLILVLTVGYCLRLIFVAESEIAMLLLQILAIVGVTIGSIFAFASGFIAVVVMSNLKI